MNLKQIAACSIAFAALATMAAVAQQEAADGADASAGSGADTLWLMSCSNRANPAVLACEFSQSIVLTRDGQRVATASFAKDSGRPGVTGVFTVPVGVHLPAGMAVSVDGAGVIETAFQTCDARGCIAEADIGGDALGSLRDGETMAIGVERADRQPLSFEFDLQGFADMEAMLP